MGQLIDSLKLTEPFPDVNPLWVCPITGLVVPKLPLKNLEWRYNLLKRAEQDDGFQRELYTACSQSVLFWTNAVVWTYRLFINEADGTRRQCAPSESHVPFITWEIQDEHITEIVKAIDDGYDLLTDKSRDMGATWDHVIPIYHKWRFEDDRSFLLLSRKEDCVDSAGKKGLNNPADPGTLFGKIDYITAWLPDFMVPFHRRTTMHLVNLENRSRIDGESANATAGSSDRRTAILMDEMAKMAEGESIKRSTRDVTASRLANSTPNGAGTAFSNWRLGGGVRVFVMPWWEHPEKGVGRNIVRDKSTDTEKIHSPWYDLEALTRTPKEMAIEIDMDHIGSGDTFFESDIIMRHKKAFVTNPITKGMHTAFQRDVAYTKVQNMIRGNVLASVNVQHIKNGPWKFWTNLIDGRPDQALNYVFGIDISKGMGASNSVISVGCVETRRKVAEWANANFSPHDFALVVAASAIWFGGSQRGNRPLVIWEANGDPGIYFGKVLVKDLHYPRYYLDRHAVNKIRAAKPVRYGWHSSADKKAELLNEYRRALAHGTFINPSEQALTEAESYIYFAGGSIGPACLLEENASARKTHGDRVIADALCNKGLGESKVQTQMALQAPANSFGARWQKYQQRQKELKTQDTWDNRDFRG